MTWIARAADETLAELLAGDVRLVTVHGLGGSGASSLARRALHEKPHLVADLRGCTSPTEIRARLPSARRGLIFVDDAHAPHHARAAVARLSRERGVRVVVAGRGPLGLEGEALVPVTALDPEESRALLSAELRRIGAPALGASALVDALDGWPLALRGAAASVRVLGTEAVVRRGVLESAIDEACREVLESLFHAMSEPERSCARVLARATAGLSVTELLAARVASQRVMAGLLDRGALVREGDVVRLRLPVGWFVRSKTPEPERRRADRRCADLLLREGERARDAIRGDPVGAGKALDRIAKDLLLLVSDDAPETAVRAALALEPILTGRLDREVVFGVWRRATRAAAEAPRATRAKVTLAWVRTMIARGDHEAAEELLRAEDPGADPLWAAYRAIFLAHIEAWRGALGSARALLDEADHALAGEALPEPTRTHAREDAMLQRVFVAFQAGELDETERLCRRLAADAAHTPSLRMVSLARRFSAEVLLRRDRPAEAAQLLERTRDDLFAYGDAAGALFLWSRRVEALKAAGEAARAKEEARAARTMAARAGEGAFELAVLHALDESDIPATRVSELSWRSQIRSLRQEAEAWLAGRAGREPVTMLQLDPATGVASSGDRRVSFARSRTLFALLDALATAHARGRALSADELFALGWPEEHAEKASKKQRVQTAVWTLRKKLLGDALVTEPHGYSLAPSLRVVRTE
ncbi:MAG: hypothetical protein JNL79_28275 [Myxococcales bacterium]|nr:hypothetical protein [Myxococcales bacterium]